ncbi:MAG: 1-(5-phosphoribosyl)-5-[(5-phosphoribosylamino)methylideneamino] imidazole-4-carboxamide isomerase, partial [Acidobacteriota bacterium]
MTPTRLVPSIDVRHGKVVRLQQGDDARRTVYDRDPADLLREFAAAGVALVHLVDLDAAFGERPQRPIFERLAASSPVSLEMGGGLRDEESVAWALSAGIERVVLGSMVARETDRFLALAAEYPGRLVPAIEASGGLLKVAGWVESASVTLDELCARLRGAPCPAALVTDVGRDGTMDGPNIDLALEVHRKSGIPAMVSGGVRSLGDLERARQPGVEGVIVGRAFYEGRFTLQDAVAVFEGPGDRPPGPAGGGPSGLTFRVIPCL